MYSPNNIFSNTEYLLYWNRTILTDRTISHNRPDIVLTKNTSKTTYLIDISIPLAENIDKKHNEKIQKYLQLSNKIKEIWSQNTVQIVPIIIGATGEIPKHLFTSLEKLNVDKNIYLQLQKAILLDTCNLTRKFLGNTNTI